MRITTPIKKWQFIKALSSRIKINAGCKIDYYRIIALFRIAVATLASIDFLSVFYELKIFASDHAILPLKLGLIETEYHSLLNPLYTFIADHHISITAFMNLISALYLLVLVSCILGFHTRKSFFAALTLQLLIFRSIPNFNYGYDHFITMSFFYCLLFPVGTAYALDNYRQNQSKRKKPSKYFSLIYYLQTHLCIVYLVSGLSKVLDPNWWNGNAIWRAWADLSPAPYAPPFLLMSLSLSVAFSELLYPLLIFTKLRKFIVVDVILIHLGIGIFLGLSSFAVILIAWNLTAFYKDFIREKN